MSMTDTANYETEKMDYLAEISREQYADYITRFRPTEDKLINSINNKTLLGEGLDAVGRNAETAGNVMTESALMRAGRTGGMSAEQRQAFDKKMELGLSATEVGGRNVVRSHIDDRDNQNLGSLVNTGQVVKDSANSALSAAASLESSRNATNAQIAASNTAGRWGMVGTGVGLAILA